MTDFVEIVLSLFMVALTLYITSQGIDNKNKCKKGLEDCKYESNKTFLMIIIFAVVAAVLQQMIGRFLPEKFEKLFFNLLIIVLAIAAGSIGINFQKNCKEGPTAEQGPAKNLILGSIIAAVIMVGIGQTVASLKNNKVVQPVASLKNNNVS